MFHIVYKAQPDGLQDANTQHKPKFIAKKQQIIANKMDHSLSDNHTAPSTTMSKSSLYWFRRDLRLEDNHALQQALAAGHPVQCVFIFDTNILASLSSSDRRLGFIWHSLLEIRDLLRAAGGDLWCETGEPQAIIPRLAIQLDADTVYANEDYEPYARQRDQGIAAILSAQGKELRQCKDQVIFAKDELLTGGGKPFTVFTPYCNAWLKRLTPYHSQSREVPPLAGRLRAPAGVPAMPNLSELGFTQVEPCLLKPGMSGAAELLADFCQQRIQRYHEQRDYPAVKGVSYLSTHLRFGTVSIRQLVQFACFDGSEGAACWLKELIWREFYQQLLWHFPEVAEHSFKPQYRNLAYPNRQDWLESWQKGLSGYPLIDAAMRQLNQTGYMHNRLRMVAASFLVKDLLIDWRLGERYFAEKLLDFDLASNNGGWQWAASTGCDAQPYFRIFNPVAQSQKFDPAGRFIRRYLPELAQLDDQAIHAPWLAKQLPDGFALGRDYPLPIVDHAVQRQQALALFGRQ